MKKNEGVWSILHFLFTSFLLFAVSSLGCRVGWGAAESPCCVLLCFPVIPVYYTQGVSDWTSTCLHLPGLVREECLLVLSIQAPLLARGLDLTWAREEVRSFHYLASFQLIYGLSCQTFSVVSVKLRDVDVVVVPSIHYWVLPENCSQIDVFFLVYVRFHFDPSRRLHWAAAEQITSSLREFTTRVQTNKQTNHPAWLRCSQDRREAAQEVPLPLSFSLFSCDALLTRTVTKRPATPRTLTTKHLHICLQK